MVDLPIPQQQPAITQAPTQKFSGAQVAAEGEALAHGVASLGQGVQQVAVSAAEQAGRDAALHPVITRDKDGNIQAVKPQESFLFNAEAQKAYDHAATTGTLAQAQAQTTMALNEIRQKYDGDPEGFKTAAQAYQDHIKATYGASALGVSMLDNASTMAAQHYNGLVNTKAKQDEQNGLENIKAQITAAKNELGQMAQQGASGTEQFAKKKAEIDGYYKQLSENPNWGMPEQVVANLKTDTDNYLSAQAVIGHMDATFKEKGLVAAQKELHDAIDGLPGASDAQRAQLKAIGEARLNFQQGQTAEARSAAEQNVKALEADWSHLKHRSDAADVLDAALKQAVKVGDAGLVDRVNTMKFYYKHADMSGVGSGPTQQKAMLLNGASAGAWSSEAVHGAILGQESGKNPNIATSIDGAAGIGQITPGTFKLFARPGERIDNPADNYNVSRRIIDTYMQKYGGDASRVAVAYFSGEGNVAPMASATPWKEDRHDGNNKYVSSYVSDVLARLKGQKPSPSASANGLPFTQQQLSDNPYLLSGYLREVAADQKIREQYAANLGPAIIQQFGSGIAPSPQSLATYEQLTRNSTDPTVIEQRTKVMAATQAAGVAHEAMGLPQAQRDAYMNDFRQQAAGADLFHWQIAERAKEDIQRQETFLHEHPVQAARNLGWTGVSPRPLNFDNHDDLAAAMQERSAVMSAISKHEGVALLSAVPKDEVNQWKSMLETGSAQQKLNAAAAISSLPEAQRKATLAAIAKTGADGQVMAVAGRVAGLGAPQVAEDIMRGQQLIKAGGHEKFLPKQSDFQPKFAAAFPANDFGDPNIRSSVLNAVKALYVAKAADAGDETGKIDKDRLKSAVDAVTGGIVEFKGSKIMAPSYGAAETQVRDAINGLTDADFAGAKDTNGNRITAQMVQRRVFGQSGSFQLESRGEGTYRVYSGGPDVSTRRYAVAEGGGPFILDLGARTREVMKHPPMTPPPIHPLPENAWDQRQSVPWNPAPGTPDSKLRPINPLGT